MLVVFALDIYSSINGSLVGKRTDAMDREQNPMNQGASLTSKLLTEFLSVEFIGLWLLIKNLVL